MKISSLAAVALFAAAAVSLARAADAPPTGYLGPTLGEQGLLILSPPPAPDTPEGQADRRVFEETRKLEGTPRWRMATSDANARLPGALHAFDCAVGATLDPTKAPVLFSIMSRALRDDGAIVGPAKKRFDRPRPIAGNDAPTCTPRSQIWGGSYPSGHSTAGWTWAMILAELAPDRAGPILARGRAYGDSRVVCGAHFVTDVQAGRITGSAVVAQLDAKPAFQTDMKTAKRELDALRAAGGPPATECAAEAALVAQPGY